MLHPPPSPQTDGLKSNRVAQAQPKQLPFEFRNRGTVPLKPVVQHKHRMAPAGRFAAIALFARRAKFSQIFEKAIALALIPAIAVALNSGSCSQYGIDNC